MATRAIRYFPIDDVPGTIANPKDHDIPGIISSMKRFGFMDPPLLDGRTGRLVGGNGRIEALQAMRDTGEEPPEGIRRVAKVWSCPIVLGWESASDVEARAAAIGLNRYVERGGWLVETLVPQLSEISETPLGLEGIGYTPEDLLGLRLSTVEPTFAPLPGDGPRLDQRNAIECPSCHVEFRIGANGKPVLVEE